MPSDNNESVDQQPSSRRAEVVNLPTSYATYVDRWAIVVGVSKYKHDRLNLKYADRDAEALYELLLTASGGGFEKDHIVKLVNEEATTANITRALRSFLKKPAKEDIVLIYFACHGAPDRERPDILYLITHDTDPDEIAGTGLPMREIKLSLQENLLSERVIMIADTCHSAGISGEGTRNIGNSSDAINLYLKEASMAKKGLALLTSAAATQASFEHEKWGGGHGVFTHFLLEGMRGAADNNPKNGVVTVRELFEYVRQKVKEATNNEQHPCIGNEMFDPNLPIAITAGISAQEHFELGCQLYQIGLKLDDRYCFESASRHLREAIRQAAIVGGKLPEAHFQLGLALTASLSKLPEAVNAFDKASKASVQDADYYLGIACLKQGVVETARQYLEAFLGKQPDSDKADAVRELISWLNASNLSDSESVNRVALLIGINYSKLEDPLFRPLKGAVNDIEILNEVLSQKYKFKITMLSDMEATYENIINAFNELQEITSLRDIVVIYYGGHGDSDNWIAADTKLSEENERLNIIGSNELFSLVDAIPALHKHLIIDANFGSTYKSFIARVEQTKLCTLLLSASPGQLVYEFRAKNTEKSHSYFTYTLAQELQQASEEILWQDLFEQVKEAVQSKFQNQTPFFLGNLDKPLFFANLERCPELFTFSQRRCYSSFDDLSLQTLRQKSEKQLTCIFPDFYYSLGLASLEKGNNAQASALLKISVDYGKQNLDEKVFALGVAQFRNQFYRQASQSFQRSLKFSALKAGNTLISDSIADIDSLIKSKRYALLVGIDTCLNTEAIEPIQNLITVSSSEENVIDAEWLCKVRLFEKKLGTEELHLPTQDLIEKQKNALNAVRQIIAKSSWATEVCGDEPANYSVEVNRNSEYEIWVGLPLELSPVLKVDDLDAPKEVVKRLRRLFEFTFTDVTKLFNNTPVNDTLALRDNLIDECNFQAENIKILINSDATRENILTAFRELVSSSQANSTLFYFAGRGSTDPQDNLTVLAFDSRSQSTTDIQLTELANLTNDTETNLLSVIDSSWTETGINNTRYIKPDNINYPKSRGAVFQREREASKIPQIGCVSIYPGLIQHEGKWIENYENGSLTSDLIQFFKSRDPSIATYLDLLDFSDRLSKERELLESLKLEDRTVYLSSSSDILQKTFFSNYVIEAKVQASLLRVEQESTRRAVLSLQRLIEQRNGAVPEELFNLGIVYYRLNEYDRSIAALQTAIEQVSGQNSATGERQTISQQSYPEAHYWLGRILYESKRDPARAVSELRLATQQDPDNSAAHYYLGKALRDLVEQEILTEAERAFQTYLNAGAPLGQQEEVQKFFKSRKASKTS